MQAIIHLIFHVLIVCVCVCVLGGRGFWRVENFHEMCHKLIRANTHPCNILEVAIRT